MLLDLFLFEIPTFSHLLVLATSHHVNVTTRCPALFPFWQLHSVYNGVRGDRGHFSHETAYAARGRNEIQFDALSRLYFRCWWGKFRVIFAGGKARSATTMRAPVPTVPVDASSSSSTLRGSSMIQLNLMITLSVVRRRGCIIHIWS